MTMKTGTLTLLVVLGAASADAAQFGDFTYQPNGAGITITRFSCQEGEVTIPDTIDGLPVTEIGESAFRNCMELVRVTIPESVSRIGKSAFSGCTNLTTIQVVELNPSFLSLDGVLFDYYGTTLILCPEGKSGAYAIPDGVTRIERNAFAWCSRLTAITIPDLVTRIGKSAFVGCYGLTDVMIPGSVNCLEEFAFADCRGLTGVSIEEGVTCIEDGTFAGCISLSEINLPDSVTEIGAWAFSGCSSLPRLILPRNLLHIGELAFGGCTGLTTLEVDGLNPAFSTLDGVLFDKNRTALILCPRGKAGDYAIPDGVSRIGERAFAYCSQLSSITISDSVTSIGDYAMAGCSSLSSVRIPRNVTAIGARPFSGSTNLSVIEVDPANIAFNSHEGVLIDRASAALTVCPERKIGNYNIPEGVVSVGDDAFAQCSRLTTVTLPQSVANLGERAFFHCTHLVGAYFAGNAPVAVDWSSVFVEVPGVIVYHRPGATGWTPPPPYLDRPTALWLDPPQYGDWLPTSGLLTSYPASAAETDDPDGDGMSNVAEMLAGTDPIDQASALVLELEPRLNDLAEEDRQPLQPGQYAIYFRSVPGKQYGIQWIGTLDGPQMVLGKYGWGWELYDPAWQTEAVVTATTTQTRFVFNQPEPVTLCRVILAQ